MEPKFIAKPGFKTVGMIYTGKAGTDEIPELWGKFAQKMGNVPNRVNKDVCYGVVNPFGSKEEEGTIDYVAAVEVENFDNIPDGMVTAEIPEAYYAVFTHKGQIKNFMETIKYVYGEWLPKSEYNLTGTPELEIYDERFNPEADDSECDIYLPVAKK